MRHGEIAHPAKCPSAPQPSEIWDNIAREILGARYRCATELELQDGLAIVLRPFPNVEREARLGPKDRVDFLLGQAPNLVALEVKIHGPTSSITRQLERYAQHAEVAEVWLVTTRAQHKHGIPPQMWRKPVRILYLAGSAL